MKLSTKISLPSVVSLLVLGAVVLALFLQAFKTLGNKELEHIRQTMMNEKTEKLRNLTEVVVKGIENIERNDSLSKDEKIAKAKQFVKGVRYDGSNYFWVNDLQAVMVTHPIKPQLDGKDLSGLRDPDGKKLFLEMVEICKKQSEGTVGYSWSKPGSEKPKFLNYHM